MDTVKVSRAVNLLIHINRAHKKMLDSGVCSRIGFHRTQHIILMHLARHNSLPSQKELAEHLGVTAAAVTGALKKLECDGYIERKMGGDNRYNEISITDVGRQVVEESKLMFQKMDQSLFIGFTDDEISSLIEYLERVENNLSSEVE
ncbi:MAG: MarR family transcriptional regulator [Ruminococcaceae bacterium]|nr:MarR family transcriptional regulator [Oscillospiraceae bacterium]